MGAPGLTAMRLAQPPPSRLAVPSPVSSLLTDDRADAWAGATTDALVAAEVPAFARDPRPGDWKLVLSAELRGGNVIPVYVVQNPKGEPQGTAEGGPVPAAEWANGDPAVLKKAAAEGATKLAALLTQIEAARQQSDPNSLLNRPARIAFSGVTGAPGDGNTSLDRQMRQKLAGYGDVVQDTARGADFTLVGQVKTTAGAGDTLRVEIQWIVNDARGEERGRVVQLNEVPPHSLDRYWGDVAVVVAQEAAGGVHDVVLQQTGRAGLRQAAPAGPATP